VTSTPAKTLKTKLHVLLGPFLTGMSPVNSALEIAPAF
jgi:hypothetical protein